MKVALIWLAPMLLTTLSPRIISAQSITAKLENPSESVKITEPAKMTLEQVFKMSDVIALVRVVSGDTENYKIAMYKTTVVKGFKGTDEGKTIYFGQYSGVRLGSDYVVFLRNAKEPAVPTTSPNAAYGTVKYLDVFNQGYTAMESSYSCVFDGIVPNQSCDYGVRICTDYIVLPKAVRAFPPEKDDPPFGCRWVRKSKFVSLLDEFAEPGVVHVP
jgi:hypothetical protein